MNHAIRQLELRGLMNESEQRARALAARLGRMSEGRHSQPQQARLWFVAADRFAQLAWLLAQAGGAIAVSGDGLVLPPERVLAAQRTLEDVVWRLNLLALECSLDAPEGTVAAVSEVSVATESESAGLSCELARLTQDVSAIWTSWQALAAEAAWAARDADLRRAAR